MHAFDAAELETLRTAKGWTRGDLANAAGGFEAWHIFHWETGRGMPTQLQAGRLAAALGVPATDLLYKIASPPPSYLAVSGTPATADPLPVSQHDRIEVIALARFNSLGAHDILDYYTVSPLDLGVRLSIDASGHLIGTVGVATATRVVSTPSPVVSVGADTWVRMLYVGDGTGIGGGGWHFEFYSSADPVSIPHTDVSWDSIYNSTHTNPASPLGLPDNVDISVGGFDGRLYGIWMSTVDDGDVDPSIERISPDFRKAAGWAPDSQDNMWALPV